MYGRVGLDRINYSKLERRTGYRKKAISKTDQIGLLCKLYVQITYLLYNMIVCMCVCDGWWLDGVGCLVYMFFIAVFLGHFRSIGTIREVLWVLLCLMYTRKTFVDMFVILMMTTIDHNTVCVMYGKG